MEQKERLIHSTFCPTKRMKGLDKKGQGMVQSLISHGKENPIMTQFEQNLWKDVFILILHLESTHGDTSIATIEANNAVDAFRRKDKETK